MKAIKKNILLAAFVVLSSATHAQEQGFRWGKWSEGQLTNMGNLMDEVVDSYIDSVGNTYIFGRCGMSARLGGNGPYINPMDSIQGYSVGNIYGVFLAKIDTLGNVLWCKSARGANSNSPSIPWNNIVVKDNRITIAFDFHWGYAPGAEWFYFFDTILTTSSDMFTFRHDATCFATFDSDGNLLDFHSVKLYAYCDEDYISFYSNPFGFQRSSYGNFLVDENDNIHIFACSHFFGEDSLHKAYIIVDGDTNRKYPLNIKTQNGKTFTTSMYFKMDSDWNMISSRFLIDSISVWNPDGLYMAYIEFKDAVIEGDEIYASCFLYNEDIYFNPDTLPIKVYLDSVHYLRIDNTVDWRWMPCLLKLNRDGEIVWVQQLYNEPTTTKPNNYMWYGSVATDEENVYVYYIPSWVNSTRFYIDGAHSIGLPFVANVNTNAYCLVVSYNRSTGSYVDYYVADTINTNYSQNSLAIIGDELLLNVDYRNDLKKTELCKINKHTKEVTWSSPIQYNFLVESKNMSVNDHGWVFRGEIGDQPRVYDSIFLGNYQEASVMTLFYDSSLDLHRPKPCSPVDSLWSDGTAGHTVTLSWSSSAGHPGYELAYIPETDSWDNATVVETSDTTLVVTLPNDGCHLFRVRALCDGNRVAHSAWSDAITVCPGVGIGEADGSSAITIYPNPFSQRVTIESSETLTATAWLTDLTGRREEVRLTPEGTGRYILDLTARPQATYLLTLTTADGKTHTVRLMKMSDIFTR
ncbi:MAG: T9SS type A sorting domain-containing protein [Bacteroidales bacterium]|nr:T9SS type A sorting domain-containing protein [Bacteroidales bacterium]